MDHESYSWISRRAHQIWQEEGCPEGKDREHWAKAMAERMEVENGTTVTPSVAGHAGKILVVEDEPIIRYATVDALEEAGFEVLEAGNADEAFAVLANNRVDAVFTDVNMPGSTDGIGLTKQIRANSPNTRVIVTSGHVRLGRFDLASGVSFIPKPYTYDALIGMLRTPPLKRH